MMLRALLTLAALNANAAEPGMTFWRGAETSAFTTQAFQVEPFDRAVMSWNATGPAVFELETGDGVWRVMGRWGSEPRSEKTAEVDVDTLKLSTPASSVRFRVTPEKGTTVTLLAATTWTKGANAPYSAVKSPAWGKEIAVPHRWQGSIGKDGERVCSPTSLGMLLEKYGAKKTTPQIAAAVYDHAEDIYGNWPFNTAYAAQAGKLEAYVRRFSGLEPLEEELEAGRPVIVSYRFKNGAVEGAPFKNTDGHLLVVAGFDKNGDVIVADPAGKPGEGRRVYKREQFYKAWLENASGIGYVLKKPAATRRPKKAS